MLSRTNKITITALALVGVMSVGAVAAAQAGTFGSDDRVTTSVVTPSPSPSSDDGLRGDGSIDDDGIIVPTPSPTSPSPISPSPSSPSPSTPSPSPTAPNGLPTDADHPQGDDSIGRTDDRRGGDDDSGDDDHGGDDDDSDDDSGRNGGHSEDD